MPTYSYKAIASNGKAVEGTLTAENEQIVLRMLDDDSLFPVSVQEGGVAARRVIGTGKRRVRPRHVTMFYNQMADLLRAGVPMLRALDTLARLTAQPVLAEVVKEIREDVAGGSTLAEAMGEHPNAFSSLHVSMIRAGESGGFLEDVLSRIARFAEQQDALRDKLIGSMIYPCILVGAGVMVVTLLMTFVVPEFREFLKEEHFSVLTKIVFGTSDVMGAHSGPILVAGAALIVALWGIGRTEQGRQVVARIQLRVPGLGPMYTMVAICRFCRILGTLLHNGVPILQALQISRDSAGNVVLAEVIEKAGENVKRGESLSKPLGASGLFPLDIIAMMSVAEESNSLETVLIEIADTNEARTSRRIDVAVRLLEPILLVVMAGLVLCIALGLLLPILTMSQSGLGM